MEGRGPWAAQTQMSDNILEYFGFQLVRELGVKLLRPQVIEAIQTVINRMRESGKLAQNHDHLPAMRSLGPLAGKHVELVFAHDCRYELDLIRPKGLWSTKPRPLSSDTQVPRSCHSRMWQAKAVHVCLSRTTQSASWIACSQQSSEEGHFTTCMLSLHDSNLLFPGCWDWYDLACLNHHSSQSVSPSLLVHAMTSCHINNSAVPDSIIDCWSTRRQLGPCRWIGSGLHDLLANELGLFGLLCRGPENVIRHPKLFHRIPYQNLNLKISMKTDWTCLMCLFILTGIRDATACNASSASTIQISAVRPILPASTGWGTDCWQNVKGKYQWSWLTETGSESQKTSPASGLRFAILRVSTDIQRALFTQGIQGPLDPFPISYARHPNLICF